MNEIKLKPFESAVETTKQLIALSTGLVVLSITFRKDLLNLGDATFILFFCWIAFFCSILFGVMTLMALTGSINKIISDDESLSIYSFNISFWSILQTLTFLLGLIFLILFGHGGLKIKQKSNNFKRQFTCYVSDFNIGSYTFNYSSNSDCSVSKFIDRIENVLNENILKDTLIEIKITGYSDAIEFKTLSVYKGHNFSIQYYSLSGHGTLENDTFLSNNTKVNNFKLGLLRAYFIAEEIKRFLPESNVEMKIYADTLNLIGGNYRGVKLTATINGEMVSQIKVH